MITAFDIIDIIYTGLQGGQLATAINGGLYKHKRPVSSTLEDVVVNCLPVNANQMQTAIANVNIHVPNISVTVAGTTDNTVPNHPRMKELAQKAVQDLESNWASTYSYHVQQAGMLQDDDFSHYINIRIEFFNINI